MILSLVCIFLCRVESRDINEHLVQRTFADTIPHEVHRLIDDYYRAVSGEGTKDWDSFHSLFAGDIHLDIMGVDEQGASLYWHAGLEDYLNHLNPYAREEGFYRTELDRKVNYYGNMAQVWSVFASRNEPGAALIDRGIFSFHLMKLDTGWRIVHLMWQSESNKYSLNGY